MPASSFQDLFEDSSSPSAFTLAVSAIIVTAVVYVIALPVDVLEVDQAQYAWMSRELLDSPRTFLEITCRGRDYLDKPPLLLWTTALSYLTFGVGNAASRIPQLLVLALGIFSTARLGRRLYGARVGILAALFLAWSQAYFHMAIDVRTDGMLTGFVAFALWQLVEYDHTRRLAHLVLGAAGVGLAMLAKGPLGIMVPALAIGADMLLRRRWKNLFRWQWLLVPAIALVVLAPMLWGLYTQFGERGPEFFFWTQSFGRITGENKFTDDTSPLYFIHTSAWAFLPWTLLFFGGVGRGFVRAFRALRDPAEATELLTWGGVVLTLAGLSASQYKLPHYCYVVAPLAAILAASVLVDAMEVARWKRVLVWGQGGVLALSWGVLGVALAWVFAPAPVWLWVALGAVAVGAIASVRANASAAVRWALASGFTILAVNLAVNGHVFPSLLTYQSSSAAGRELAARNIPAGRVFQLHRGPGYALDFYWGHAAPPVKSAEQVVGLARANEEIWVLVSDDWTPKLEALGLQPEVVAEYEQFTASRLTAKFLDPRRRLKAIRRRQLLRISQR